MGTTRSLRGHQIWLITRTITDQIGLHLVPLPLLISTKTEPLSLSLHVSASSVPLLPVRLIQSVASYRWVCKIFCYSQQIHDPIQKSSTYLISSLQ